MQQYSEITGKITSIASGVQFDRATFRTERTNATNFCKGNLACVQNNHSMSVGSRKQARAKRTLRKEKSVMEYFWVNICAESNVTMQIPRETDDLTLRCEHDQSEHETSYTIYPATWLIRLGIHHGLRLRCLSSSTQGWKYTLETICPVPDNALIFEFCKTGNVPAVWRLLSGGHA